MDQNTISEDKFNLIELKDPNSPFFYLVQGDSSFPIQLRRVDERKILVDLHEQIAHKDKVTGFVVMKDDAGILQFESNIKSDGPRDTKKFDIIELHAIPSTSKLINRREFRRIEIVANRHCTLTDENGGATPAKLTDISASGVGLETNVDLNAEQIFTLTMHLPDIQTEPMALPITIVHLKREIAATKKSEPKTYIYGAFFVLDNLEGRNRRQNTMFREKIIKFVNRTLIERKKNS